MIASALASVLVSIAILYFYVVRGMLGRLSRLQSCMMRLSEGDLQVEIPRRRGDEIGAMANSVSVFMENALEVKRLEQEAAEQAAIAEREKQAVMNSLAEDFERRVGSLLGKASEACDVMDRESRQADTDRRRDQ